MQNLAGPEPNLLLHELIMEICSSHCTFRSRSAAVTKLPLRYLSNAAWANSRRVS